MRAWVGRVLGNDAWKGAENESQSSKFNTSDVELDLDEHAGLLAILRAVFTAAMHKVGKMMVMVMVLVLVLY